MDRNSLWWDSNLTGVGFPADYDHDTPQLVSHLDEFSLKQISYYGQGYQI